MRTLIAGLLLAVAACSLDPPLREASGGSGGTPAGGSGGDETAACFEPDLPCRHPDPTLEDATGVARFSVRFDPEAHCGEWQKTYWLCGEEGVAARLFVGLGTQFQGDSATVTFRFILDGQITEAVWDDEPSTAYRYELKKNDLHQTILRFPAERLGPGGHTGSVLLQFDDGNRRTWDSHDFAIMANGSSFPEWAPSDITVGPARQDWSWIVDPTTGEGFPSEIPYPSEGKRPLRLVVPSLNPDEPPTTGALLALLDGEQIPFGELGLVPTFTVQAGYQAEVEWEQEFPASGGLHQLEIFLRVGFNEPAEDQFGERREVFAKTYRVASYALQGSWGW